MALCLLMAAISAASASAEDSEIPPEMQIPPSAIEQAEKEQSLASRLTDPEAAAQLPHQDLGRAESMDLMDAVFGPVLESPAGPFDDLHVEEFLF
jgi:hypothetical protein